MKPKILKHVDFKRANVLLEGFNESTGFVTAILDLEGNILSESGWRIVCKDFHRKNPETASNCFLSDTLLANKINTEKKYHFYKCMNGLIDVRLPIVIKDEHIANLFSGQFFFEKPEMSFFKEQAKTYGFDEKEYLEAIEEVPLVSKEELETAMNFLLNIIQFIIEMAVDKLEQIEINEALRKSEKALCESEEKFQLLFNKAPLGYQSLDFDGNFIEINQKWLDSLGYSREEVIGKWFGDFLCPEFVDGFRQRFPKFKSKGYIQSEFEMMSKDGKRLTMSFEGTIGYGKNGEFKQTHCILQDITDQRKLELEVSRVMTQNQRILDNLQDSYFQVDLSGNLIVVNPQAVHMYGYSYASELIGQPAVMVYADPDDRIRMMDVLQREGVVTDFIVKGLCKDGTTLWVSINVQFVKDEQGRIIGTEGLARDISERITMIKRIELQRDSLIASNTRLANLVEQSVSSISKIGELRDAYTAGHQKRVQYLTSAIARELGLSENDIINLSYGAIIHDIGKIYIPSEILNKPGKISNLEWQIIQTHVEQGYNVVKGIDFPDVIPAMIYQHHERLDGSGYPQGLSGKQIIIESRILAVADVVEAMTSHRPYRPALGIDAAIEEITTYRGQKYDNEVVETCIKLFKEKGFEFDS